MTRHRRIAALLTAALMAAAAPALAQTEAQIQTARGRVLVERNCGMCHAAGPVGPSREPLAPPFRDLNQRYNVDALGEALAEGILTGHPAMPEFRFQPDEVAAILSYLKSIQAKQHAAAGAPGQASLR
jgi:mono/diheme cytochrome c family protein